MKKLIYLLQKLRPQVPSVAFPLADQKGMAIVMAVAVILLVVTVSLELHINERTNLLNAAAKRDRITLDQMATSGIHLAMAVLVKDRLESESDSLQEDWADEETMAALVEQIPFENGKLEVKIIDEMSKIQINALVKYPEGTAFNEPQRKIWERFAGGLIAAYELLGDEAPDLDDLEPMDLISAIKDWIDTDEDIITGLNGAESDYYKELDPPYECKNGPFDDLSEVRLVKGVTPELFNGIAGAAGLSNYITVYGVEKKDGNNFSYPGKVNINTAELPILKVLLPPANEDFADLLIEYREATSGKQYTNDITNINWYKNVPGLNNVPIDEELISVSSSVFRIVATATLNDVRAITTAIVQRERDSNSAPWSCKILNWKTE